MKCRTSSTFPVCMVLISLASSSSCRVTSQSVSQSQQTQKYERLEIIYRAHPASGPLFSSTPHSSSSTTGIVQAAASVPEPQTPFQDMKWSKAELRIECPHPDGRSDYARVTLHFKPVACGRECELTSWGRRMEERIGIRQSRNAEFRERWFYDSNSRARDGETYSELDLPKAELDAILGELDAHGFFNEHGRPSDSESQLEVRLNRRWTSKCWGYEPQLDALSTRVYEEGTLRTATPETPSSQSHRFWSLSRFTTAAHSQ